NGKFREAVPLFRAALKTPAGVQALLGLERAYAELSRSDSLLGVVDTLIAANPHEETYRTVQLRTLQGLGREADLRRAFERWIADERRSAAPYREYSKILRERNRAASADSVIGRARSSLGGIAGLELQVAQLRAATGDWLESARAWR